MAASSSRGGDEEDPLMVAGSLVVEEGSRRMQILEQEGGQEEEHNGDGGTPQQRYLSLIVAHLMELYYVIFDSRIYCSFRGERNYGSSDVFQPTSTPSTRQWFILSYWTKFVMVVYTLHLVIPLRGSLNEYRLHKNKITFSNVFYPGLLALLIISLWRAYTTRNYDRTHMLSVVPFFLMLVYQMLYIISFFYHV